MSSRKIERITGGGMTDPNCAHEIQDWRAMAKVCEYRCFESVGGQYDKSSHQYTTAHNRTHNKNPICVYGMIGKRCMFNMCRTRGKLSGLP